MQQSLVAIFLVITFKTTIISSDGSPEPCQPESDVCEFWLTIEERLVLHQDNVRVVAINGSLYKHDQDIDTEEKDKYKVFLNRVITMDGYERAVIVANNSVPGPPLVAYKGQKVIVHVHNHLLSESVTIHWHGIHQKGTPFSDGVAFISQCPILPGQKFAYEFKAEPSGTFFYHSHVGGQRVDGLFGAFIIKPKPQSGDNTGDKIEDHIMHVGDWFHSRASELHAKMIYGNYKTMKGFKHPQTIDGVQFAPYGWKSAYIEGRGQYYNPETGEWTQTPNHVYNITTNKKYRFRVIGAGLIVPLRISVDGHVMSIVATDGYEVQPTPVESLIINPGERYDFILTANQTVGNYWVRCESTEGNVVNHYARAILRYDGAAFEDPTTSRMACTAQKKCVVLNCMFPSYPAHHNTECLLVHDLRSAQHEDDIEEVPVFTKGQSREIMLNWVAGDGRMVVNGNIFEHPAVSSATQHDDIRSKIKCNETSCIGNKNCYCYHEIDLPKDETIQMVWTNHGNKKTRAKRHHPIHLHGHSFHVLKVGFGEYNQSSGLYQSQNEDIHCSTDYCNQPAWSNQSFGGDSIPGLRMDQPIQKDTLMVPTGAYAVIRFRTNNPGKWFLHCHIEYHSMQGMAMVINEAPGHHPPRPKGFPICQNYYSDDEKNIVYEKQEATDADDDEDTKKIYLILFITFLALACIEFFIIIAQCCTRRSKSDRKTSSSVELKQGHAVSS